MTEILKGSTYPPEEIRKDQLAERFQEFRTRVFWDKPPQERSGDRWARSAGTSAIRWLSLNMTAVLWGRDWSRRH